MRTLRRCFAASLAIAVLSSCGGGNSGPPPPTISASSPPAGTAGVAYAGYTFAAAGGTPPMSWSESGSLPPGLQFSTTGQLSGDPATAGTYPITVTVTDSSMPPLRANAQVSLQINDSTIVIAPASPPAGTVSYPYSVFSFGASGGSPPYSWKASGTLPPGMTFDSDGNLAGTPTQAGTFAFSVTASDSAQQPMSSAPLATQITIGTQPPLMFNSTPAPPDGLVGIPYGPFSFNANGGYLPLQWSITAGNLPPGLTLGNDGSLSGTPTSTGTFTFTVTVTDSAPKPVSMSLPFTINVTLPLPPVIDNQEAPTGTVGVAYTPYQFTASNGVPPLVWSETPPLNMGLSLSAQGVLSGTPTAAGQFPVTLNVMDAVSRSAPPFPTIVRVSPARPPASFTNTGSMKLARSGHTATLLLTGKVLVTGGGNGSADPTAELYDPATGTFSSTAGNMTEARSAHTATVLKLSNPAAANYGKVLIVGSLDTSAELYDPVTGTFAATGSMHHARTAPTATLLNTDKVLIVGGNAATADLTAELYDPATGTFADTGSTTILRTGHTATLLADGRVLIAGGNGTATAELYDPAHGTFTATSGSMTEPRSGHTATLLGSAANAVQKGYVLIIGTDASAELYDPSAQTFARVGSLPAGPARARTASLRSDGTVLAAGGAVFGFGRIRSEFSAALFAPESDGFTVTGSLNTARDTHTATVLPNGDVLVVGGTRHSFLCRPFPFQCHPYTVILSSAEVFK
jgi:hypothetical protein